MLATHILNRFDDPTKDFDVTLEMRGMRRKLGRSFSQASGINTDTLDRLLLAIEVLSEEFEIEHYY